MATKQFVEGAIEKNTIVVFSKSYCPYCKRAKSTINGLELKADQNVKIYELDEMEEGSEIQSYLLSKTGQRTVPNIFINKEHIGGNDALQVAHQGGKVKRLLEAAA